MQLKCYDVCRTTCRQQCMKPSWPSQQSLWCCLGGMLCKAPCKALHKVALRSVPRSGSFHCFMHISTLHGGMPHTVLLDGAFVDVAEVRLVYASASSRLHNICDLPESVRHAFGKQHAISVAERYDELHMTKSQHPRLCFLTKTSAAVSSLLQALAHARSAEQMQVDWLRYQMMTT